MEDRIRIEIHRALDAPPTPPELRSRVMSSLPTREVLLRRNRARNFGWASGLVAGLLAVAVVAGLLYGHYATLAPSPSSPTPTVNRCAPPPSKHSTYPLGQIDMFQLPSDLDSTLDMTAGPSGGLWILATVHGQEEVVRMAPSGVATEFSIPTAHPAIGAMTTGSDGSLWLAQYNSAPPVVVTAPRLNFVISVFRLTPSGAFSEYKLGLAGDPQLRMASGPDCNLWITDLLDNKIIRLTPSGEIAEFAIPTPGAYPGAITAAPDGNMWFIEGASKVGRVTPSGEITEITPPEGRNPIGITTGPDGNLWVTSVRECCGSAGEILKLTPAGAFTSYAIPSLKLAPGEPPLLPGQPAPSSIVAGSDGNLWFTAFNNLDRVTPAGAITQFVIPPVGAGWAGVANLVAGPDGNLWFFSWNPAAAHGAGPKILTRFGLG